MSADLIDWADEVFVMEKRQLKILRERFGKIVDRKQVACLNISDQYEYMQPELIELLKAKMRPYLAQLINKK